MISQGNLFNCKGFDRSELLKQWINPRHIKV